MATLSANLQLLMTLVEQLSSSESPATGGETVRYDGFNTTGLRLNASSSPALEAIYAEELTGPQSLDFTALTRTNRATLDATAKKLLGLLVNNSSTTDNLVISDGGANPYQINGGADITIPPTGKCLIYFAAKLGAVGAAAKNVDFTAAAGEDFQLMMIFGT